MKMKPKTQMLVVAGIFLIMSLFVSLAFGEPTHSRSEYLQHIETKADITSAYTWYRVCNPVPLDFTAAKSTDFNVTFVVNNNKLLGHGLEIRNNLSGLRNITVTTCNPYYINATLDNGTILSNYISNCTLLIQESYVDEYKWQQFNPDGFNFKSNTCYDIKVVGNYPPAFGSNSVNIDNVIGYNGISFTEYAVWLAGWDRRKAFYVNESNNTNRMNYPLGMFEATGGPARSVCMNFSKLDNYDTGKQGEIRILDNTTNTTIPFELISNTSDSVCVVMILNLTANGNDSFYIYWNNSNAPNITYATDFNSVSPAKLNVSGREFGFRGSSWQQMENFKFGRNTDGQELITGITNDNGVGDALARNAGSCQFSQINGTVVKWLNCSNSGVGMTCVFAAFNNFSRCFFSGFGATADDGLNKMACGDDSAETAGHFYYRDDNGIVQSSNSDSNTQRRSHGIVSCGKDYLPIKAFAYWNRTLAITYSDANSTTGYSTANTQFPIFSLAATAYGSSYKWNMNAVSLYLGLTGNLTTSVHETYWWLEKRPIISFSANETSTVTVTYASESQARTAIEIGINSSTIGTGAARYTDQQVYARNLSNSQVLGRFDKVALSGNQRWAFNYITSSDTNVSMFNLTPALYTLEMSNLNNAQITDMVSKLINNTKQ